MRYLGGKTKIAKPIAEIINNFTGGGITFVSLFCGSCVIESLVKAERKILNDKHEYLIAMYKALQNGYELPENLTREEYYEIKANKDKDKALAGFVGFGCSFGGKWFGGYAKNRVRRNYCLEAKKHTMKTWSIENYCGESKRGMDKAMLGIKDATFTCLDYKDVEIPPDAIVYCDPPYADTTGYSTSKGFDYNEFWNYMRKLSKTHTVFISEEKAPDDFECIWSKEVKRVLDVNKSNIQPKVEKLFIYKGENKNV